MRELRAAARLPFGLEVVAFAEGGQRYKATFLGSSALTGHFDPAWLDQRDADGVSMREAMTAAGLPGTMEAIAACKRDPARYLGFVEVHIEQAPCSTTSTCRSASSPASTAARATSAEISALPATPAPRP